jgi:galactokinase
MRSGSVSTPCRINQALIGDSRLDRIEIARICQRAEIEFVGMPCGIMDQFVSLFGQEHAAILVDCRNLAYEAVSLPPGMDLLAVNTMVKHELASSAYRERTEECAAAIERMGCSLRDVTLEQFQVLAPRLPEPVVRRARHVITENARVLRFVEAARRGDLTRLGQLFVESHRSLQHDYEVSCPELDFLVDTALAIEGVLGARMTGGGFGGCTVNLLRAGTADAFSQKIACAYEKQFGMAPDVYLCRPAAGAAEIVLAA